MRLHDLKIPAGWKLTVTYPAPADEMFPGQVRVAVVIEDETGKFSGELRTSASEFDDEIVFLQEFIDMIAEGKDRDTPPPLRLLP